MMYIIIELAKNTTTNVTYFAGDSVVFGPFKTKEKALDFCNARIELLASEWSNEDGIITDNLSWKLDTLHDPS